MTDYSLTCAMRMYNTITNPLEAAIVPLAPLVCFPGSETSGTAAKNIGTLGLAADGTISGVTLNAIDGPGGTRAGLFDGVNDIVNIYSAALAGAFSGVLGTFLLWTKVYNASVWTDGKAHQLTIMLADSSNRFTIYKSATNNRLDFAYRAGGVSEDETSTSFADTNWHLLGLTWSDTGDQVIYYGDGSQVGATDTGIGTWAGALNSDQTLLGAFSVAAKENPWYGYLSHAVNFSTVLTLANFQAIYAAGQAAAWTSITVQRKLALAQGSLSLSGQDAGFARTRLITAVYGAFAFTGQDAGVLAARQFALAYSAFAFTGQDTGLLAARQFTLAYGAFALSGQDSGVLAGWLLALVVAAFALTGKDITMTYTMVDTLGSVTGSDAAIYAVVGSDTGG